MAWGGWKGCEGLEMARELADGWEWPAMVAEIIVTGCGTRVCGFEMWGKVCRDREGAGGLRVFG